MNTSTGDITKIHGSDSFEAHITRLCSNSQGEKIEDNLSLIEMARQVAHGAFKEKNDEKLATVHRVLNKLLSLDFYIPANDFSADRNDILFSIKQILISSFLEDIESRIDSSLLYKGGDFKAWWQSLVEPQKDCPHELFSYLNSGASLGELKTFITHDATVHVPFNDALAFMQVGTRGETKSEFFENFSDEVGHGEAGADHLDVFNKMLADLGIDTAQNKSLPWQALACGNMLMVLSLYRSLFFVGIGYMGCLEAHTPGRFKQIIEAGRRLGLPDETLKFYIEHAECDDGHAEGWLDHVILPTVQMYPEKAGEIAKGLLYRFSIADSFWKTVLDSFKKRAA